MININIGDFVETVDGRVGYVASIVDNKFSVEWREWTNQLERKTLWTITEETVLKHHFKRIGSHDFTVKENKIEPLKIEPKYEEKECMIAHIKSTDYPNVVPKFIKSTEKIICGIKEISNVDLYNKLNEIIEYINKEDK